MCTEDNLAGNPVLGKGSCELGPLASYKVHVNWGEKNKSSQLSELLKAMLKGNGNAERQLNIICSSSCSFLQ